MLLLFSRVYEGFFLFFFIISYSSINTYTITSLIAILSIPKPLNITTLVRMQGNSQGFSYNYIRGCLFVKTLDILF